MDSREQELLTSVCRDLGLQEDVKIVEIKGIRWTLEYTQSQNHPDFGNGMIKLERNLQLAMKKPVDLRLLRATDKNKRFDKNYLRGVEAIE